MSKEPAKREWTPRMWLGCSFPAYLRLLCKNRFAVHPRFLYMPFVITTASIINSALAYVQESWYGSKLDQTPIVHPPLFIIGHWRTGTTLLHEMITLDARFTSPTTYQCLVPHHFLLSEGLGDLCFRWMLPSHRPMDNVVMSWSKPQEDEFALCMLGQSSPYLTIAFPNRPTQGMETLGQGRWPTREREAWKTALVGFLRRLTYRDPRRLVLKSPTHSCRIPTLLELFPQAQFLHIVRNPYIVHASTMKLWQSLYEAHGFQVPNLHHLEEHVFSTFSHLYTRIEAGKKLVPEGNFHEMKYEDLLVRPFVEIEKAYGALGLGVFEEVRPRLRAYWQTQASYQTNRHPPLSATLQREITRRWGEVIERYGYQPSATP
jgi:hypothetical protein